MSTSVVPELRTTSPRRGTGWSGALFVLLVTAGLVGLWAGTQVFAYRLEYHANLGPTLFELSPRFGRYILVAVWGCAAGAVALLTRPGNRRYAIPLVLVGVLLSWVPRSWKRARMRLVRSRAVESWSSQERVEGINSLV